MIYNNNIQYQLDTHLEVRHLANSVQESCFSAEYTLKPIKAQTLPFGERDGMNLYEISIPNFLMSLDKSLVKSSDFSNDVPTDMMGCRFTLETLISSEF